MKCPNDSTTLSISDKQGVEIDYCPECRGVWLDRGELDKLIERSDAGRVAPSTERYEEPRRQDYDNSRQKPKKRESFLGDLFDF